MAKILFMPFEKEAEPDGNQNVLELARNLGLPLQSTCGGKKICGKCRIIVERTEGLLPPPSEREQETLGRLLIRKGYRLACEILLTYDAVIRIPEESLIRRQIILTSGTEHLYPVRIRPGVNSYYVEVPEPPLDDMVADRERLLCALKSAYGIKRLKLDPFILRRLPRTLRSGQKGVTAVLRDRKEIVGLYGGKPEAILGMAFDIGTTTVVGYLVDLDTGQRLTVKSAMNPQIPYGDDVINRISFCQDQPEGIERLRSLIVQCLNDLIAEASADAGIESSRILEVTVAGNSVMHHLLIGLDPGYLALAPYPPVLQDGQDIKARDLGIRVGDSAYTHFLPLKAGFLGGDAIACVLAAGIHKKKGTTLLIDLGTNGEIILGNKERLLCCSTAAGPAFEGGHIEWGMRAAAGAIERARIDPQTFEMAVKTIDDQPPVGLCGSGIISAVAEMIRAGIILSKGNFIEEIRSPRLREGESGWEFVLVWSRDAGIEHDIVITQKDVSELQMAKSAIHAGATLLLELFKGEQVQRILLAGACGNYVDVDDACTIDLFPGWQSAQVIGIGNAAGDGSCLALLDRYRRREAERIARDMEYQELAATERFQELFVTGMFFRSAHDYQDEF